MGTRVERILALATLAEDAYADYCATAPPPPPLPPSAPRRSLPSPPGPHAGWFRLIQDLYLVAADPMVTDFDSPTAGYSALTQLVVDLLVSRSRLPADDQWLLTTARGRYAEPATNFISSQLHSEPNIGPLPQTSLPSLPRPLPRMPIFSYSPTNQPSQPRLPLLTYSLDPHLRISPSPTSTVQAGEGNANSLPDMGVAAALQESAPSWFERYLDRAETLIRVQRAIERIQESLQSEPGEGATRTSTESNNGQGIQVDLSPVLPRINSDWSLRPRGNEGADRTRRSLMERYAEVADFLEQAITMQRARARARVAASRDSPVDNFAPVPPWRSPATASALRSTSNLDADQSALPPTPLAALQPPRRPSPPQMTNRMPNLSTPALWSPIDEGWSPIPPPASDPLVTSNNRRSFPPPLPQRRTELLVPYEPLGLRRIRRLGGDLTEAIPPSRTRTRSQSSPRGDWLAISPSDQSNQATVRLRNRLQILPYRHPHRSAHVFADGDDPNSPWTLMEDAERALPHPSDGITDPDGENFLPSPEPTFILSESPVVSPAGSPEQRPAIPSLLGAPLIGRERWQLEDVSSRPGLRDSLSGPPTAREDAMRSARQQEIEPLLAPPREEADLRATRAPRRLPSITDEDVQDLRPPEGERSFSRAPGGVAPGAPALQTRRAQNAPSLPDNRLGDSGSRDTRLRLRSATEAAASWYETRALLQELRSRLEDLEPAVANARASIADARTTVQEVAARSANRQDLTRRDGGSADPPARQAQVSPRQRNSALGERDEARLFLLSHRRGYSGDPAPVPTMSPGPGSGVHLISPSDVPNRHPHPPSPAGSPPPILLPAVQPEEATQPAQASATLPPWLTQVRSRIAMGPYESHVRPPERAHFHGWIVSQATLSRAMDLLDRGHGTLPSSFVPWAVFIDLLALHIVLAASLPPSAIQYAAAPLPEAKAHANAKVTPGHRPARLEVDPLEHFVSISPKLAVGNFCLSGAPFEEPAHQPELPSMDNELMSRAREELLKTVVHDLRDVAGRVWDASFELSACADLLDGGVPWELDPCGSEEMGEKLRENDYASPLADWQALHLLSTAHADVRLGIRPSHIYYVPRGVVVSRVLAYLKHMQRKITPPSSAREGSAPLLELTEVRLTRSLGTAGGGMLEMRDKKQLDSVVDCALSSAARSPSSDAGTTMAGQTRQILPPRLFSAMDDRNLIPPRPRPNLLQALPKVTVAVFCTPRGSVTDEYLSEAGKWISRYEEEGRSSAASDVGGVWPHALLAFAPGHAVAHVIKWYGRPRSAPSASQGVRQDPAWHERKRALAARMDARADEKLPAAFGPGAACPAAPCLAPIDARSVLTLAVAGQNAGEVLEGLSVEAVGITGHLVRFDARRWSSARACASLFSL